MTEVIISKHRNGPTGTVELDFWKEYGRFQDERSDDLF
ncbi:DnaB-like helicase C-terminal domain-containing protein [Oceanobacillus senegalensis]|nr:DnaB-like helicase C-terminal domain-containing protein [Oceanobacillus senegalensis]